MKVRELKTPVEKSYVLVFDKGDEVISKIKEFARSRQSEFSTLKFEAIGALKTAVIAYFNMSSMEYEKMEIREQVEVTSLIGNVTRSEGDLKVHAHITLGKSDGAAVAGHLVEGVVSPTLEVFATAYQTPLNRRQDGQTGLFLIDLDAK